MAAPLSPHHPASTVVALPLDQGAVALAGLIWRPLSTHKLPKRALKPLLQQTQCDYFVLHPVGEQLQCGLAPKLDQEAAYHSVALLLIEPLGENWIAIFQLPDQRYLLIGVHDGQVVPGCDSVLATDKATIEQFTHYQTLFQWQAIYAPHHLNLCDEERALEALLASSNPRLANQLQSYHGAYARGKRLASYVGIGVVTLLLIAAGGRHYQQKRLALQLAKQRLIEATQQKKRQAQPVCRQQPPADILLSRCVQALSQYPVTLAGWRIVNGVCTPRQTHTTYQRLPPHTHKGFLTAVRQRYNGCYQFSSGGNSAEIKQPLIVVPSVRTDEPHPSLLTVVSHILEKMESGAATGQIDDVLTKAKESANFELTSEIPPPILLKGVDLTGVVIHRLYVTIGVDGAVVWKFSGTAYGQ